MSFRRYQKSDKERLRKHRPQVSDTEDWRSTELTHPLTPNAVMQLQRTIGNQAVQRLIQRDSGGNKEQAETPPILASITFNRYGKLKGNTKVAGHEGKIDVLSLQIEADRLASNRDEPSPTQISITRNVDDLSPQLLRANAEGEAIKAAQFEFVRPNDEGKVEVAHSMEFSDGYITSHSLGGGSTVEQIGMEFKSSSS